MLAIIPCTPNRLHALLASFPDIRRGRVRGVEFVDYGAGLQRLQSPDLRLSVEQNLPGVSQLVAVTGPTLAIYGAEYLAVLCIHVPIADKVLKLGASLGELVVAGGGAIAGDLGHFSRSLIMASGDCVTALPIFRKRRPACVLAHAILPFG